ncbi:hypothetical protein D046_4238, partial [Vibrio parahaemolyticus V-223/04]
RSVNSSKLVASKRIKHQCP